MELKARHFKGGKAQTIPRFGVSNPKEISSKRGLL